MPTTHDQTKTPWKVEVWNYAHATPPRKELNIQTVTNLLATLQCDYSGDNPYTIPQAEAEANAAFIVRAVNSHDELLEATKLLFEILDGKLTGTEKIHAIGYARQAIAHAEGRD